jgi:YD repeat-containing protein
VPSLPIERLARREASLGSGLCEIELGWTINDWVDTRTEVDYTVTPTTETVVTFDYDNRGRLIGEERTVGQNDVYDLAYTYDQLGNRQTKSDAVSGQWVVYDYDVEKDWQPEDPYPTWHNRLLEYRMYDRDPNDPNTILLRTVSYTYYKTGQASNITVKDEDRTAGSDLNNLTTTYGYYGGSTGSGDLEQINYADSTRGDDFQRMSSPI